MKVERLRASFRAEREVKLEHWKARSGVGVEKQDRTIVRAASLKDKSIRVEIREKARVEK
jgi:hypothetical protein